MRAYFTEILGNEYTKRRLFEAVSTGTLPHAFLIVGPRGSGKLTLARELCCAMNCEMRESGTSALPCGECNSCRRIREGIFPDMQIISKEAGRATIGVDEIKGMREDVFLSSTEAEYKFYIISEAELLTPQAQNALLKVFEEPPKNVHIILLATEADKILTTVKSRSQFIQMELFPEDKLRRYLIRRSPKAEELARHDEEKLKSVLLTASGVLGNALLMLDDASIAEQESRRATVKRLITAFPKKVPFNELYTVCSGLPQKREELREVLEETLVALRDLIGAEYSDGIAPLFFTSREAEDELLGGISARRLVKIFDIITDALGDLDKNVMISPLLTDIAVRIKEA